VGRSFELFQKFTDVIETQSGPQFAQILRLHFEWLRRPARTALKTGAECLVDDIFKRLASAPSFGAQFGFYVVIQS
jgi:hypothetical protein